MSQKSQRIYINQACKHRHLIADEETKKAAGCKRRPQAGTRLPQLVNKKRPSAGHTTATENWQQGLENWSEFKVNQITKIVNLFMEQ